MPGRTGSHYQSEVWGWTEWSMPSDTQWYEVPSGESIRDHVDPENVEGVWVYAYNPDIPADNHWFWVRSYYPLDWDQWDDLIENIMDMHNMAMA